MTIRSVLIWGLIVIAATTLGCSRTAGYPNYVGPDGYYVPPRDYVINTAYFDGAP